MDTSRIEAMIAVQCDGPNCLAELNELLTVTAERQGVSALEGDLVRGTRFVLD